MAALVAMLLLLPPLVLSEFTPPLPQINAQQLSCSDPESVDHLACQLQQAKLKLARLENVLDERSQSLNAKVLHLQERDQVIEDMGLQIQNLRTSILRIKADSLCTDKRLDALEEEVRLLWDASRRNNFELFDLEAKAEEAETKLEELKSQAEKVADIVTEQWIQIQNFEQALQMTEMRVLKAQRLLGSRCTFLKFVNHLYGSYILKTSELLKPYGSSASSFTSQTLSRIKTDLTAAKRCHHELQGLIKQKLERNKLTAKFANEELVFFMASAILTLPVMVAWVLLSSQF